MPEICSFSTIRELFVGRRNVGCDIPDVVARLRNQETVVLVGCILYVMEL